MVGEGGETSPSDEAKSWSLGKMVFQINSGDLLGEPVLILSDLVMIQVRSSESKGLKTEYIRIHPSWFYLLYKGEQTSFNLVQISYQK